MRGVNISLLAWIFLFLFSILPLHQLAYEVTLLLFGGGIVPDFSAPLLSVLALPFLYNVQMFNCYSLLYRGNNRKKYFVRNDAWIVSFVATVISLLRSA